MKVSELLNEAYKPGYDSETKNVVGTAKAWLDKMGATPEDVVKALDRVKATPLFRNELPKLGMVYAPTPIKEKNGTLNFTVRTYLDHADPKVMRMVTFTYMIYANGQIRQSSTGDEQPTKLTSPKPAMVAGNVVSSLVKTWTASLEELVSKRKKQIEKEERRVAAAKKAKDTMKEGVVTEGRKKFSPDVNLWKKAATEAGAKVMKATGTDSMDWTFIAVRDGKTIGKFSVKTNVPQNSHGFLNESIVTEALKMVDDEWEGDYEKLDKAWTIKTGMKSSDGATQLDGHFMKNKEGKVTHTVVVPVGEKYNAMPWRYKGEVSAAAAKEAYLDMME